MRGSVRWGGGVFKAKDRDGFIISWKDAEGRRQRRTVKVRTVKEAQAALQAERAKVEKQTTLGMPLPSDDSFAKFADEFLEIQKKRVSSKVIHGKVTAATLERQTGIVNQHFKPFFGAMRLAAIRRADVVRYIHKRTGDVAGDTIIKEVAVLKRMLNIAVSLDKIPSNPAVGVELPKASEGRTRHLTNQEWWTLFDACRIPPNEGEEQEQWLQHAAGLAVALGTRRGELLATIVPDVDLDNRVVTLRRTKNGKIRLAHINDLAMQVLTAMNIQERIAAGDKGKLFRGITPAQLTVRFIRACETAGIEDFSFHDLRHTFASLQIGAGTDLYRVQVLLGHSDPRMTQRYAHLEKEHLAEAAQKLNAVLIRPDAEAGNSKMLEAGAK